MANDHFRNAAVVLKSSSHDSFQPLVEIAEVGDEEREFPGGADRLAVDVWAALLLVVSPLAWLIRVTRNVVDATSARPMSTPGQGVDLVSERIVVSLDMDKIDVTRHLACLTLR
jgi:hypothetical protein